MSMSASPWLLAHPQQQPSMAPHPQAHETIEVAGRESEAGHQGWASSTLLQEEASHCCCSPACLLIFV